IARQMRLSKFEQPLFDTDSYNGFGRKTRTGFNPTGGPVPKFNEVKNNSGVEIVDDKTLKFKTYRVKETLDNFATPDFVSGALHSFNGTQDYERFGGSKVSKELFYRLFQQRSDNPKFVNKIFEKKFDFIIVELGLTEILNTIFNSQNYSTISLSDEKTIFNDNVNEDSPLSISPKLSFLRQIKENKTRFGCLLNVPDILEVPYFKQINQNLILKNLGNIPIKYGSSNEKYKYLDINKDKLLPFSSVDSLLSSKVHISLKRGIYNNQPLNESVTVQGNTLDGINFLVSSTNLEIANLSRKFNFPIVDINSLYKNIINKKYVLDSGIIIDANSFFSSDGIYPSITGQVIIANEVIKTLNLFYETEIPLISMQEYIAQ
ncbi:MAG: hypothetical protein MUF45_18285, partial [Spirosomaceae bacterium]|nr:hypothetical protein [Spirosomataceae bacterium]